MVQPVVQRLTLATLALAYSNGFLFQCLEGSVIISCILFTVMVGSCCFSIAGYREGLLWKRGRDNGQFLSRKFILSEREGALKYFNKHDVSTVQYSTTMIPFRHTDWGHGKLTIAMKMIRTFSNTRGCLIMVAPSASGTDLKASKFGNTG